VDLGSIRAGASIALRHLSTGIGTQFKPRSVFPRLLVIVGRAVARNAQPTEPEWLKLLLTPRVHLSPPSQTEVAPQTALTRIATANKCHLHFGC
jgi:hypothetical protein